MDLEKTETVSYESPLPRRPRWRALHNRQSLRRLRDPRTAVFRVGLSIFAVSMVALLGYLYLGDILRTRERVATASPTTASFTRPLPAAGSLLTSTATVPLESSALLVATFFPTNTLPVPTATAPLVVPTRPLPTHTVIPPTMTSPPSTNTVLPPTRTDGEARTVPTVTALVLATQTVVGLPPSSVTPTQTPLPPIGMATPSSVSAAIREHVVQADETASVIAERYNITMQELTDANRGRLDDPTLLQIGMTLSIPPVTPPTATPEGVFVHTVESGETIWSIAQRFKVRRDVLLEANRDIIGDPRLILPGVQLIVPLLGAGPPTQ